jgi:hypothetical protein
VAIRVDFPDESLRSYKRLRIEASFSMAVRSIAISSSSKSFRTMM